MARNLIASDLTIKSVKAGDPRKRLNDGDGLYLLLSVNGGSHGWRFDYSHEARRKTISLGIYPDTGLKLAREKAADARSKVAAGVDPSEARQEDRKRHVAKRAAKTRNDAGLPDADSFEAVFIDWLATRKSGWSGSYAKKVEARIRNDVLPWLGKVPISTINEGAMLQCLRRVEARGAVDSAHSTLQACGQVFVFAIASGLASRNPAQGMSKALKTAVVTHMAALIDPARFGALMRGVAEYRGNLKTRIALELAALTFQRPGNVYAMEWAHIDLDGAMWSIPSANMKRSVQEKISGKPHFVPLAPQAVAALRELHPVSGHGRYVFPSLLTGERSMSENTLNTALRRMGFTSDEMTSHGFRASARTILCDYLDANPEVVEAQLAHVKSGPLGSAYDRAEYMQQRRALMRLWADCIDALRDGKPIDDFKLSAGNSRAAPA